MEKRFGGAVSRGTCLIVTDSNVARHADTVTSVLSAAGWRCERYEIEPGETSKRLDVVSAGWDRLVEMQADRQTVVVAVGGGVVGDAAGFIAAAFARGVPFVQIPTTLLADVDSSVGGKVGINHPRAKNLIGAFHQPIGVLIDLRMLETLPDREYRAGLAEVVKYGMILDAAFFEYLERNVTEINCRDPKTVTYLISRSCELKAQVVEEDEFETTGVRAILNFGHTFAHAFEALSGYESLLHGEAVSVGMVYACRLAEYCGRTDANLTARLVSLLEALHLPVNVSEPGRWNAREILGRMQLDKKTVQGTLRFVLPNRLGEMELVKGVPTELVLKALQTGGIE
jgi:3-dehydroquinate synthase